MPNFCFLKFLQDAKLRQIVTLGSQDTLEEKTVTICYGCDFVNMTFVNFCCTKKEIAQVSLGNCCLRFRNVKIRIINYF